MQTFEVAIRLVGPVSILQVVASDSSRARQLVRAQYHGASISVLGTRCLGKAPWEFLAGLRLAAFLPLPSVDFTPPPTLDTPLEPRFMTAFDPNRFTEDVLSKCEQGLRSRISFLLIRTTRDAKTGTDSLNLGVPRSYFEERRPCVGDVYVRIDEVVAVLNERLPGGGYRQVSTAIHRDDPALGVKLAAAVRGILKQ